MKSFDMDYYGGYRIVFNDYVLNVFPPPTVKRNDESASINIVSYLCREGFFNDISDMAKIHVVRHESGSPVNI